MPVIRTLALTEIAQRVGLHKATTHRIVATLPNIRLPGPFTG